jgi:hypothetical protein
MMSSTLRFLSTSSIRGLLKGMSADVIFSILMFGIKFSGSRVTLVTISAVKRTLSSALHADRMCGPNSLLTSAYRQIFFVEKSGLFHSFPTVTS